MGAAGRTLSPSIIAAIDQADEATGLGDRSRQVAELISGGKTPEEAIKEAYTPRTAEEVRKVATRTQNLGTSARSLMSEGTEGFTAAAKGSARGGVPAGAGKTSGIFRKNMPASPRATVGGGAVSVSELLYIAENDTERGERIDQADDYQAGIAQIGASLANQTFAGLKIVDDGPVGALGSATRPSHVIVTNPTDFGQTVRDE